MTRRKHAARGASDPLQLPLGLETPPATAEELLARLQGLGLRGITRCVLTENRTVMVSFTGSELRVHRGYLDAPAEVLQAIARFVSGRTRSERREAQRVIVTHPIRQRRSPRARRRERPRREDLPVLVELRRWHRELNRRHFAGSLRDIALRISRRMRTRLGQYTAPSAAGDPPEIALSATHVERHAFDEVLHTLLHEMVHQWQSEHGHPIDHGRLFREKALEVGIEPAARRKVAPPRIRGRVLTHLEMLMRAARQG
ncbi:MAG TPA: SprT-like domain-containing protein [Gemmatimonadaceae bacterium]|nr:SprT-like domain-containing protein [Gemmatimonadaceae bacterium]